MKVRLYFWAAAYRPDFIDLRGDFEGVLIVLWVDGYDFAQLRRAGIARIDEYNVFQ